MIINYDRTVITIVNYGHETFIVQATGETIENNVTFVKYL